MSYPGSNRISGFYHRHNDVTGHAFASREADAMLPQWALPGENAAAARSEVDVTASREQLHEKIRYECAKLAVGITLMLSAVPLGLMALASWLSIWWGVSFALAMGVVAGISMAIGVGVIFAAICGAALAAESYAESLHRVQLRMSAIQQHLRDVGT